MAHGNNPTGPLGSSEVDLLEGILRYQFTDLRYLDAAVEGAGARRAAEGNKRLAQLGDAVMRLVHTSDGFDKKLSTAMVTKQHDTCATNAVLAEQGFRHEIDKLIRRDRSNSSGPVGMTLMATTVEALIGAVYKDSGNDMDYVRKAMVGLGLFKQA